MTTDEKIKWWKHQKKVGKRIGKMLLWTAVIVLVISLFSNLNTILINQSDDAIRDTDILNKLNDIEQESVKQDDKNAVSEDLAPCTSTFTITHYCSCSKCCGNSADGITATGTQATEGRTVAVDPEIIPLGTEVTIDNQVYIAEDVGGAIKGNEIDIFESDHETALSKGIETKEVTF